MKTINGHVACSPDEEKKNLRVSVTSGFGVVDQLTRLRPLTVVFDVDDEIGAGDVVYVRGNELSALPWGKQEFHVKNNEDDSDDEIVKFILVPKTSIVMLKKAPPPKASFDNLSQVSPSDPFKGEVK